MKQKLNLQTIYLTFTFLLLSCTNAVGQITDANSTAKAVSDYLNSERLSQSNLNDYYKFSPSWPIGTPGPGGGIIAYFDKDNKYDFEFLEMAPENWYGTDKNPQHWDTKDIEAKRTVLTHNENLKKTSSLEIYKSPREYIVFSHSQSYENECYLLLEIILQVIDSEEQTARNLADYLNANAHGWQTAHKQAQSGDLNPRRYNGNFQINANASNQNQQEMLNRAERLRDVEQELKAFIEGCFKDHTDDSVSSNSLGYENKCHFLVGLIQSFFDTSVQITMFFANYFGSNAHGWQTAHNIVQSGDFNPRRYNGNFQKNANVSNQNQQKILEWADGLRDVGQYLKLFERCF